MDSTKQPKPSARKQIFSNSGSEKSVKKSKSKKKKSSKRRHDKEIEKSSTSPDLDISDGETESANQRTEAPPDACKPSSKTSDSCPSRAKATALFSQSQSSSQANTAKIAAPPSVLLLQPHAKGYGESKVVHDKVVPVKASSEKVVPAKVVPKTSTVPTPKPRSISSQTSVKSSRSDLTISVKDSASRQSVISSKSYTKNNLANLPELNKEALRWEYACADSDDEEERINQYKLNRRKRYLAASNKKYSDWLKTLHENISAGGGNTARQDRKVQNGGNHSNGYAIIPAANEGLVPGLGPALSLRNPTSQVLLNS